MRDSGKRAQHERSRRSKLLLFGTAGQGDMTPETASLVGSGGGGAAAETAGVSGWGSQAKRPSRSHETEAAKWHKVRQAYGLLERGAWTRRRMGRHAERTISCAIGAPRLGRMTRQWQEEQRLWETAAGTICLPGCAFPLRLPLGGSVDPPRHVWWAMDEGARRLSRKPLPTLLAREGMCLVCSLCSRSDIA